MVLVRYVRQTAATVPHMAPMPLHETVHWLTVTAWHYGFRKGLMLGGVGGVILTTMVFVWARA